MFYKFCVFYVILINGWKNDQQVQNKLVTLSTVSANIISCGQTQSMQTFFVFFVLITRTSSRSLEVAILLMTMCIYNQLGL